MSNNPATPADETTNHNQEGENNTMSETQTNGKPNTETPENPSEQETVLPVHQSPSHLAPLPNNRPIEPTHLRVAHTYHTVGSDRPITESVLDVVHTISSSGIRPVTATTLHITEIIGNRPIAPNEDINELDLMGYLD
jgi:hypothetical protein